MTGIFKAVDRPELLSPPVLAYLGDAVYELYIRSYLVASSNLPPGALHRLAKRYVSASAQSGIFAVIEGMLTAEEQAVYRRGRNANPSSMPKNASVSEYVRATGFEALIGYLYLKGEEERLNRIIEAVIKGVGG